VGFGRGCGRAFVERGEAVDMLRSLPMRVYLALSSARDREEGQAMVEYSLILFLVALVSIAVLSEFGGKVSSLFTRVNSDF
jgi:Flp pilus assembly pilin Flp